MIDVDILGKHIKFGAFLQFFFLCRLYRFHKLRKTFSKFYRCHSGSVEKYNVSLRKLLQQGISEPEFNDDLVTELEKLWGNLILRNTY